jgi:mannose-6-phosphate isomerase-like protein (cupin superfamily)
VEIRRFGPGHRKPLGEPAAGLASQVIWSDARAHVAELAFSRRAAYGPSTSPSSTLFVVVSGGGWVQVADERVPVRHGEAVVWPAAVPHAAWTDGIEMRAIIVELPEDGTRSPALIDGAAVAVAEASGGPSPVTPARGRLADREPDRSEHDPSEGEPW